MVFRQQLELHVSVHRPWTEDSQAVLEQFDLHCGGGRIVTMSDAVVYHLRDNSFINLEGVIRLCAKRVSPNAEVKLLLDEFYCLVGDVKKISLEPLV